MTLSAELLVCDTTIVSMLRAGSRQDQRRGHWPAAAVSRLGSARLAISVVTLAETELGFRAASVPPAFIESERRRLRTFGLLPIDPDVITAWADLRHAVPRGRVISDNDIWIAATARSRAATVATADKDFLPLAEHVNVLYLKRRPDSGG